MQHRPSQVNFNSRELFNIEERN